jgi:hypothetical protein
MDSEALIGGCDNSGRKTLAEKRREKNGGEQRKDGKAFLCSPLLFSLLTSASVFPLTTEVML